MEDAKFVGIPPSAFRHPPPPSCRWGDGSISNIMEMVGDKRLYMNSRTRSYYFRRCKKVRSTNIEHLPDELLLDILVRLSADNLYDRVRLVCRRWYRIIHSDAFINTHLQHSTYGLLLSWRLMWGRGHPIFVTATQGRIETSEFSYKCRTRLSASCNGLAMELHCSAKFSHIINPATKQPFILPSVSSLKSYSSRCGIAFAAASMEYKVALPHWDLQLCLAILTVGVDNSWRQVRVEHLSENARFLLSEFPLITEGFMHWAAEWKTCVLTLDVETEILTVSEVPYPQAYQCKIREYYLSTGRCLSLLVAHRDLLWEVWEMKPKTGEWTKLRPDIKLGAQKCRLQQFACGHDEVLEPLGWVKYPEVLALRFSGEGRTCIFYNLDTHELNSTELPGSCAGFCGFVHKNSLKWLS